MSNSRRSFLHTTLAAGFTGAAAAGQNTSRDARQGWTPPSPETVKLPNAAAELQVPKMKFFNAEIGRLVLGTNPFYGFSHYNNNFSVMMQDYYRPGKVCDVMHQANRFGVNAFNYVHLGRAPQDLAHFQAEGGKMHLIVQCIGDAETVYKAVKPLAMYKQGEEVDKAFQNGEMDEVKEWCKRARGLGVVVGVGTHKPEVIAYVEEQGWDVDFYAGCVYNRTRTGDEWKQVLHGESLEMSQEIYLRSDPPRMYKVMRQTKKPCFAFKILAAGRLSEREMDHAYQTAFESIKATDGVFVGIFPRVRDEIRENVERIHRVLVHG
jgi:hypothetical protein